MSTQDVPAVRQGLVDQTMARLAEIEERYGATREGLDRLEAELKSLARHKQLFVRPEEFQPAKRGTFKDFIAYRLNRDDGTTRALYVSLALPGKTSPPHNHKNWAVLVGLDGVEINHIYRTSEQGLQVVDTIAVGPDVGLSLLGDDIHSIDVQGEGDVPVWQLRLYERALDLQVDREQFGEDGKTSAFAPNPNTPDAVAG